jgi:hypothetical protein
MGGIRAGRAARGPATWTSLLWIASAFLFGGAARAQTPAAQPDAAAQSTALPPAPAPTSPPPVPDAAAVDLYKQARKLVDEGNWKEACPKLEAVLAMQETPALRISLGDCHEHDGRLAAAYADYQRAQVLNQGTTPPARQAELEANIQERLTKLDPRLPRLRILIESPVAGIVVHRDGTIVPAGAFGAELPVEVGAHEVTAEAPGRVPQKQVISIKEGEKQTVRIALAAPPESGASRYAGTIVAGSLAVALGGVTAGLGAWTVGSHHDIVTKCAEGTQPCKDEAAALSMRGTLTNVFLGLSGAALVTAGVVFFAVERPKAAKAEVALSGTGASVRVQF